MGIALTDVLVELASPKAQLEFKRDPRAFLDARPLTESEKDALLSGSAIDLTEHARSIETDAPGRQFGRPTAPIIEVIPTPVLRTEASALPHLVEGRALKLLVETSALPHLVEGRALKLLVETSALPHLVESGATPHALDILVEPGGSPASGCVDWVSRTFVDDDGRMFRLESL